MITEFEHTRAKTLVFIMSLPPIAYIRSVAIWSFWSVSKYLPLYNHFALIWQEAQAFHYERKT